MFGRNPQKLHIHIFQRKCCIVISNFPCLIDKTLDARQISVLCTIDKFNITL